MSGIDNYFAQYLLAQGLDPSLMYGSTGPDAPASSAGSEVPPEVGVIDQLRSNLITRRTPMHPLSPYVGVDPDQLAGLPPGVWPPVPSGTAVPEPPGAPEPKPGTSTTLPPPDEPVPLVPPSAAPAAAAPGGIPVGVALAAAGQPGAGARPFNSNALLQFLAEDMMKNRRNDIYDKMLEFGLATMAAAGKPGSTTLGAIGEGGLQALKGGREREAADLKNIVSGANIANVLSEAGLRQSQEDLRRDVFRNPGGFPIVQAPGEGTAAVANASGVMGKNQQIIAAELERLGWTPVQIAAAIGWGMLESGTRDTDPLAVNEKGGGKGAFAWQQWRGPRLIGLQQYAADTGTDAGDPRVQARYFDKEMREGAPGFAGRQASDLFAKATTPEEATLAMAHYSRPEGYLEGPEKSVGYAQRLANTKAIFNRMQTGSSGGSAGAPPEPPAGAGGETSAKNAPRAIEGAPPPSTATGAVNPAYALWQAQRYSAAGYTALANFWAKYATAPDNYVWGPGGVPTPLKGGPADPAVIESKAAAEARGKGAGEMPSKKEFASFQDELQRKMEELKAELATNRELTVAEKQHEYKLIQDKELQNAMMKRELIVKAADPIKLQQNETVMFAANSLQAKSFQDMAKNGIPLPQGVTLDNAGNVTLSGPEGQQFGNKLQELMAEDHMKRRTAAIAAGNEIRNVNRALRVMDEGTYGGRGAEWQLAFAEGLKRVGLVQGTPTADNTRAFMRLRGQAVVDQLASGAFGTGNSITENDVKFAQQLAAGDINIPLSAARRILELSSDLSKEKISLYNTDASLYANDPRFKQHQMLIPIPPDYQSGGVIQGIPVRPR